MDTAQNNDATGKPLCPACGRVPLDAAGRCPLCGAWFAPSRRGNAEAQPAVTQGEITPPVIASPSQAPPLSTPPLVRRPGEGPQFTLPVPAAPDNPALPTETEVAAVFEPSRPRTGQWVIWLWILAGIATVGGIVYLILPYLLPPPPRIPATIIRPKKSAGAPQKNPRKQGETTRR